MELMDHGVYLGLPSIVGKNKKELLSFVKDKVCQQLQGGKICSFPKWVKSY